MSWFAEYLEAGISGLSCHVVSSRKLAMVKTLSDDFLVLIAEAKNVKQ